MDALVEVLREIRDHGPITFARFMEIALYHPAFGYYQKARSPIGAEGDYFTSPHIHFAFARCIAKQIEQAWQIMGKPDPLHIVELGSGSGILAEHIMGYLSEALGMAKVRYVGVETSAARRAESATVLEGWLKSGHVRIASAVPQDIEGACFVVANEFFDALPFHRIVRRGDEVREIYVSELQGKLTEIEGEPRPEVLRYLRWLNRTPLDGSQVEVNLAMLGWIQGLARIVRRGYVLIIDYGLTSDEIYGKPRPKGTALAYHRHNYSDDLLANPGGQDITAHVDFTALCKAARAAGFEIVGSTTQAYFLAALGIGDTIAELLSSGAPESVLHSARLAIAELVWPPGLGGFRVMALSKGNVPHSLHGFSLFKLPNPCK